VDPKVKEVRRKIQVCCSKNDLTTAMETINCALSDGIKIEAQTFYNLINLCDGFAEKGVHVGTPKPGLKNDQPSDDSSTEDLIEDTRAEETSPITHSIHGEEISNQQRKEYAFMVKGYMDCSNLPLIETAYTALVKILCRTGDLHEAESILIESEKCKQCKPRLRLYSPLLAAYAEQGERQYRTWIFSFNPFLLNNKSLLLPFR
jgi:pentatricopeptide repeat protein